MDYQFDSARSGQRLVPLILVCATLAAAGNDPQAPSGRDFATVGGNLANHRYSSLTKINKSQPPVLVAKKVETPAAAPAPSSVTENQHSAPAEGITPQVANGLMRLPSATAMGQGFVSCRLGAWC